MFGHLKAADFTNLIEGTEGDLQAKRRLHLNACAQCTESLAAAQNLYAEMTKSALAETEDQDIPEPDWSQFRAGVRNTMLSRAAQRQPRTSSWSGWLWRPIVQPVMAWGLAVAFAAGLSAGLLVWNRPVVTPAATETAKIEAPAAADFDQVASLDVSDSSNLLDDVSASPQTSIFEDLARLDDMQSEKLQRLLEADAQGASGQQ